MLKAKKSEMRETYIKKYKTDRLLQASLQLLKTFIFERAWRTTEADFALIFLRLADRALYHSTNIWRLFAVDLQIPLDLLTESSADAVIHTGDESSKYEIEAYLGAAKTLFEENLIGINERDKQNLLGKSFAQQNATRDKLATIFKTGFPQSANAIRNHSFHIRPPFRDAGFMALIKKADDKYVITIPNIYVDERDASIDIADVFMVTHEFIERLIQQVRDILLDFFISTYGGPPATNMYWPITTPFGNMMVGLGPLGYEFKSYNNV